MSDCVCLAEAPDHCSVLHGLKEMDFVAPEQCLCPCHVGEEMVLDLGQALVIVAEAIMTGHRVRVRPSPVFENQFSVWTQTGRWLKDAVARDDQTIVQWP